MKENFFRCRCKTFQYEVFPCFEKLLAKVETTYILAVICVSFVTLNIRTINIGVFKYIFAYSTSLWEAQIKNAPMGKSFEKLRHTIHWQVQSKIHLPQKWYILLSTSKEKSVMRQKVYKSKTITQNKQLFQK